MLAACSQVPVTGPVVPGADTGVDELGSVRIEAQGPQAGASPEQIVQGFLDAMSVYEVGFPLARDFLTPAASDLWSLSPVVIYDRPRTEVGEGEGTVLFNALKVADIDVDGQYTAAAPDAPLDLEFTLVEEEGEWRIADPPEGVLITTLDRDNDYSPYTTYYPSPSADILVPDVVWLPVSDTGVATILAQALVDGPTSRLRDSVTNAFPAETTVDSVSIDAAETASIALSGPVLDAIPADKQTMAAQLAYTLDALPRVAGVVLIAEGERMEVPAFSGVLGRSVFPDRDPLLGKRNPAAYALMDDRLVTVDPSTGLTTPVDNALGVSAAGALALAVNYEESLVATVEADGRSVVTRPLSGDAEEMGPVFTGSDVATPSWDRFGNLWVVDRVTRGSSIYVIKPDGSGRDGRIDAPALNEVYVLSLRVAPDGARVAASVRAEDGTTRLLFLRVAISDAGVTTLSGVAEPPALPDLSSVGDLAWVGDVEIAVVVTAPDGAAQPAIVRIDGSAVTPEVETGVRAVAGYALEPLLAVAENDTIRRRVSAITWETLGNGIAVTYPG